MEPLRVICVLRTVS